MEVLSIRVALTERQRLWEYTKAECPRKYILILYAYRHIILKLKVALQGSRKQIYQKPLISFVINKVTVWENTYCGDLS